jgi:hypothetical protein
MYTSYDQLIEHRRREYMKQFYNPRIDKKGGFYEEMYKKLKEKIFLENILKITLDDKKLKLLILFDISSKIVQIINTYMEKYYTNRL